MLENWKKQHTQGNIIENVFLGILFVSHLFLNITYGKAALHCPKIFEIKNPQKNSDSPKLVKNIGKSPTVPEKKSAPRSPFLTIDSIRYLTLKDIAQSLKCSILLDNSKGFAKITKGGATVQFSAGQDYITYQTSKIYLFHKLKLNLKNILVSYDDYLRVLVPLLAINLIPEKAPGLKTIVLDPGHGGKDPGATNTRLNISEKTLTLQIAQQLKVKLMEMGYAVILTRETDTFVELIDRPKKAQSADLLFVSLHTNSATNSSANGVEVFIKRAISENTFGPWNLIAAYSVLFAFEKATNFIDRGIKMEKFAVLKSLTCPGILVELGFISNDAEAKKLADANFQKKIIQGLADGIAKYDKNLKKKHNTTLPLKGKF